MEGTIPESWTKLRAAIDVVEKGSEVGSDCSIYECEAVREGRRGDKEENPVKKRLDTPTDMLVNMVKLMLQ